MQEKDRIATHSSLVLYKRTSSLVQEDFPFSLVQEDFPLSGGGLSNFGSMYYDYAWNGIKVASIKKSFNLLASIFIQNI